MVAIGLMALVIVQMGGVSTVGFPDLPERASTNLSRSLSKLALMAVMLVWHISS